MGAERNPLGGRFDGREIEFEGRAMCQLSDKSQQEWDVWVQNAVLVEIIALHPDHLSIEELLLRMEDEPGDTARLDRLATLDAVDALKRSGLVRLSGDVVEPTFAALRAAEVLRP